MFSNHPLTIFVWGFTARKKVVTERLVAAAMLKQAIDPGHDYSLSIVFCNSKGCFVCIPLTSGIIPPL